MSNATNTSVVIIGQQYKFISDAQYQDGVRAEPIDNITEFKQIKPISANSTNTIFLLKTGAHYDAIVKM